MELDREKMVEAARAAIEGGNVADKIRETVFGPVERAISERVSPSVQFQVDEALGFPGTQDDPLRHVHDMVADAIRADIEAALHDHKANEGSSGDG